MKKHDVFTQSTLSTQRILEVFVSADSANLCVERDFFKALMAPAQISS